MTLYQCHRTVPYHSISLTLILLSDMNVSACHLAHKGFKDTFKGEFTVNSFNHSRAMEKTAWLGFFFYGKVLWTEENSFNQFYWCCGLVYAIYIIL